MQLYNAIRASFEQLTNVLEQLTAEQYKAPSANLSGSSIGQHTRHVIELFQCLQAGYAAGEICYDNRRRDVQIETDKLFAQTLLHEIAATLEQPDKELRLLGVYDEVATTQLQVASNYHRELLYNLEHTVHHMALIRVGLKELNAEPAAEHFGIASSTIRHREQCAQ
jgi:uncharacterized damage-inducible protein DinB